MAAALNRHVFAYRFPLCSIISHQRRLLLITRINPRLSALKGAHLN